MQLKQDIIAQTFKIKIQDKFHIHEHQNKRQLHTQCQIGQLHIQDTCQPPTTFYFSSNASGP